MNEDWEIWLERFRWNLELEGLAPRTIKGSVWLAGKFVAWCRGLSIETPERLAVDLVADYRRYRFQYVNARGRRDAPRTLNLHIQAVRGFLTFLAEKNVIPTQLLSPLKYVKEPSLLPRFTPVHGQVMKLLEAIPADTPLGVRDRAMMELLYSSAIRRAELAMLKIEDVDLDGGLVRITAGKGGKDRMAPMGAHAVGWLRRYVHSARPALMRWREEHGRVFVSWRGKPLNPDEVSVLVSRRGKVLDSDKHVSPHALRRSCATELIRNGANPGHVKDILGHEDYSSLSSYVKLVGADLKEALAKYHPRERKS